MDIRPFTGPDLVTAAADADPVTLLVLGWLATKQSANTRAAYARDLGIAPASLPSRAPSWLTWCRDQEVHPVSGVTGWHVTRYAGHLKAAGLSSASVARKLAAISSWYDWLTRRGHISASPAIGLARPRPGLGIRPAPDLTREQALTLVHAADTAPGPQRARTAALVAVLILTGARVGELIGADVDDLGTARGRRVLWVTRPDGRRDGLVLPGAAAARIDAYLAERVDQTDGPVLFASRNGRRLFAADIRRDVRRVAERAGLPSDLISQLGPRLIRRSFAALYLEAGGSLRGLQGALGHADPRTTQRYDRSGRVPVIHPARPPHRYAPGAALRPGSRPHCRACGPRSTPAS